METILKIRNILTLITIVGLSCLIGYLLAENERTTYEKEMIEYRDSLYINKLLEVDTKQDSIINNKPPMNWEIDEQGNYTFHYN